MEKNQGSKLTSKHSINADNVLIKKSTIPNAGLGVFALKRFKKNELLAEYTGKMLSVQEYESQPIPSPYIWMLMDTADIPIGYIDALDRKYANWTRFVNCPRNLKEENVIAIQKMYKLFYYAKRDIKPNEELLVWYGPDYGEDLIGKKELE